MYSIYSIVFILISICLFSFSSAQYVPPYSSQPTNDGYVPDSSTAQPPTYIAPTAIYNGNVCPYGQTYCDQYSTICVDLAQCTCDYGIRCPGTTNCVNSLSECSCAYDQPYICDYGCSAQPCTPSSTATPSTGGYGVSSSSSSSSGPSYTSSPSSSSGPSYSSSSSPSSSSSSSSTSTSYPVSSSSSSTATYSTPSSTSSYSTPSSTATYGSSSPSYSSSSSTAPSYSSTATYTSQPYLTCENIKCLQGYTCEIHDYTPKCIQQQPVDTGTCCYLQGGPISIDITMNFQAMLRKWISDNQDTYNNWMQQVSNLYARGNGYYIDPTKYVPPSYYPTEGGDTCYSSQYSQNGYSIYGYDKSGYDPYGYDQSGYDKAGYSRLGTDTGTEFNQLGQLKDPSYAGYTVKFSPNGTVYTTNGEALRYDQYGYDQYGNDQYGNPKPSLCGGNGYNPNGGHNNNGGGGVLNPPCDSTSEQSVQNNKYLFYRKSSTAMTPADWARFRAVWVQLNMAGKLGDYAVTHRTNYQQHNTIKFLPWHREFLARFESDLHTIDPCAFVPYWDSVSSPTFPLGIAIGVELNFPPDVIYMNNNAIVGTDQVTRSIGALTPLPNAGQLAVLMQETSFSSFSAKLEQFHNVIHTYVAGDMSNVATATHDPVFFMVHAYIDKIWYEWQQQHPTEPGQTDINNINPIQMGGNDRTYNDVQQIEQVSTDRGAGYRYL